ncbi:acetoin dehydrogenase dihydrolipoyllysine-residue acetyltransferase subunit [Pokkaliibacter plantistimulans]|uniref:Acetoin dehydrogenase dihydrolipoyllysine-residue acetyltransferase subunit n=1 Tax=Proteobacteria bacterium 228 TaxID=2083153 RepID=A0A2S5KNT0_9PROT|nr:acetoin dehydrogenase dihydrolipoyllysine-residue acetyltransferase subunit [Pokkaliibacter plantistimulans]PPC76400.1 acetoin dehydrogenase dihydrolipoyllysine-residue acetyltransferase subunit [Pokkaliibacter plantistimulans]
MPVEVILPRVDMDMTEAVLAQWLVQEGDEIRQGDILFEIETTKANMDVEAPASGTLHFISARSGEEIPVGTTMAWIFAAGEEVVRPSAQLQAAAPAQQGADVSAESSATAEPVAVNVAVSDNAAASCAADDGAAEGDATSQRCRATPKARRLARETGVELQTVQGTGPNGRISAADVIDLATKRHPQGLACHWLNKGAQGIPLVLVHGLGADGLSWQPLVNSLRRRLPQQPVLAIDLPAHGASGQKAAPHFFAVVQQVAETLRQLNIHHCHLLGHSLGGAVALALASGSDGFGLQVQSLTLLAPAGLGADIHGGFVAAMLNNSREESLRPWLGLLLANADYLDAAFIRAVSQPLADPEIRMRRQQWVEHCVSENTQLLDLRPALRGLTMPTRVIWGLQDRIIPVRHADTLPGTVALHRFSDCGHLPQLEARDGVVELLLQQLHSSALQGQGATTGERGG